jgi:hypothetical protein
MKRLLLATLTRTRTIPREGERKALWHQRQSWQACSLATTLPNWQRGERERGHELPLRAAYLSEERDL